MAGILALQLEKHLLPAFLARLNCFAVPHWALIIPGILGIICAVSNKLSNVLIIISVFGAMLMYLLVLISYFMLQKRSQKHYLPSYRVPFKLMPYIALILGVICFISIVWYAILPEKLNLFIWSIPVFYLISFLFFIFLIY